MARFIKERLVLLISLIIVTPVGFYTKFYDGKYSQFVNDKLCDVFYVIFWTLLFKLIFRKAKSLKIVFFIFVITSLIEFSQLWHPKFLEYLRSFFFGRTLLGSQFAPSDFLYYLIGAFVGYILLKVQDRM